MSVDSATALRHGVPQVLGIARDGYDARLTPKAAWPANESLDVTVCYHGSPADSVVSFAGRGDSARVGSYGLPYSAREWWPTHDSPDAKVDSADIFISAPAALTAVSNGREGSRSEGNDGYAVTHWSVRYPIYPDAISLALARYSHFTLPARSSSGVSLRMTFYAFPEDETKARADFSILPQVFAHYTKLLGEYPFMREKYGVAEFPIQSFREHQTIPSYGPQYITGDHRNDWILAHELAHQWFGDALTVRNWSNVWLNEGFATYMALLWIESTRGKAVYDSVVGARMKLNFPGAVYVSDSMAVDRMFGATTFFKGAIVLHMLRHVMGDSLFFGALRTYVAENLYKHVTTATFRSVCERVYHRPLGWFFDEWVYGSGAPNYTMDWSQGRASRGFEVSLAIQQTQDSATFTMPVDVVLHTAGGDVRRVVMDSVRAFSATLSSADTVFSITLDPGNWVLKRRNP